MLQILPVQGGVKPRGKKFSLQLLKKEIITPKIVELHSQYKNIFLEPITLPLQRGPFDQKVPL